MEYISSEEFLKQSMNIQQEIWNWWRPSKGDLFENDLIGGFGVITGEKKLKNGLIPLLTEGQLRAFIEDKASSKLEINYDELFMEGYNFYLNSTKENIEDYGSIENLGTNLLQAYWKVACEIASKEVAEHGQTK